MSSVPNVAIPHPVDPEQAQTYERRRRRRPLRKLACLLAAPPLIALGLGVLTLERVRDRASTS